jgi:integrase
MALTDAKIKTAKPSTKNQKLSDGQGLFLLIKPSGGKYWRMKYRFDNKEKLLAIGVYPDVSLANARKAKEQARSLLAEGIDPMAKKKALKLAKGEAAANSFKVVAMEWLEQRGKKSESGDARLMRILEKDLFPSLGNTAISEIKAPDVLQALRKIESRGALDVVRKARQTAGQIFRYAVSTGRAERDPTPDLKGALKTGTTKHYASITEPKEVGKLMLAIHAYQAGPIVMSALRLAPLIFCRPGELRQLEWQEVNLEEMRIDLPPEKMKMKEPLIIPLSSQAIEILKEIQLHTGSGRFVFPNARSLSRPMSDNGLRIALRTMGYTNEDMTVHGFRAMARTLLDEQLNFPVDWIEHQLAHAVKDVNGRAYNRTKHLSQRKEMMQTWADYLDSLRLGLNNVVPFRAVN